ncbi:hypothetical protein LX81_03024 [Palleronia aestuarii]|uniref:DNA-binding phage zinc finger domain-containing protein n=1 Tax=Palleronia aestuarii TaxID=568105 RepID=A0A2W7N1G3_9RHOB|nr:hypothetical protein [Palleronia aestuarii]PZX14225.1 hypothetical protein LX81_03024 [Palleronia aestuarii]
MPDFTIHTHPVLAVPCPDCRAATGAWCKRPSGHRAADLHRARKEAADRVFISQHGPDATIRFDEDLDRWQIEAADICAPAAP